ncbi:MAG: hypothetical protein KKE77_01675 [Alphaproteobacteria bacterium]|nr:hypothetical protein [Alphaproteobacteria bacterium]
MNALRHEFDLAHATMLPPIGDAGPMPGATPGETPRATPAARAVELEMRWDALHDAADAVAQLAQLANARPGGAIATLPTRAARAGGWRCRAVANGIDDLALVMQTGLRALIGAADNGRDTTAAALTLWREFHAARQAICAFVEPELTPC